MAGARLWWTCGFSDSPLSRYFWITFILQCFCLYARRQIWLVGRLVDRSIDWYLYLLQDPVHSLVKTLGPEILTLGMCYKVTWMTWFPETNFQILRCNDVIRHVTWRQRRSLYRARRKHFTCTKCCHGARYSTRVELTSRWRIVRYDVIWLISYQGDRPREKSSLPKLYGSHVTIENILQSKSMDLQNFTIYMLDARLLY